MQSIGRASGLHMCGQRATWQQSRSSFRWRTIRTVPWATMS